MIDRSQTFQNIYSYGTVNSIFLEIQPDSTNIKNDPRTCAVDTSIERRENGEHIQGKGFIFPPTVAVKISQWHYF